jgi:hypothetical protein
LNEQENNMKWLAGIAACFAVCSVPAATFHALTLDVVARAAPASMPLEQLAADRAFARWLRMHFQPAMLHPDTRVGFNRQAALDDQLTSSLRSTYPADLDPLLRGLDRMITAIHMPDAQLLDQLFGQPGKLQLGYSLDPPRASLAAATRLVSYTLPGAQPAALSVADIFERQNVQGRMAFFARDTAFMARQARERVSALLIDQWARQRFGDEAVADLRQALSDQDDVRAAMGLYGLADGAEDVSPIQEALAQKVTKAEIRVWYQANKEQFRRIDRVRARHIRVRSEALAAMIADKAARGADFAALARAHSIAVDAARGGALGWIRAGVEPSWLEALALQQPAGKVSKPYREAVAPGRQAHWEIILVERRIDSYQPAGSETVRYLARKAIARERARTEFAAARTQALAIGGRP